MKHLLIFIAVLLGGTVASAQTTKYNSTSHHSAKVSNKAIKKHRKSTKGSPIITSRLDNRKIYHWSNGQRSTPTGKDAAPSNGGGFISLEKDTTAKARIKH
ncbi:MAG: hypothetical protein ACM3VS_02500 [Candidatus Dadabacteria bacterium]